MGGTPGRMSMAPKKNFLGPGAGWGGAFGGVPSGPGKREQGGQFYGHRPPTRQRCAAASVPPVQADFRCRLSRSWPSGLRPSRKCPVFRRLATSNGIRSEPFRGRLAHYFASSPGAVSKGRLVGQPSARRAGEPRGKAGLPPSPGRSAPMGRSQRAIPHWPPKHE